MTNEEVIKEFHIKYLSKAKTTIIDGQELTVLPYGFLSEAIKQALQDKDDEWRRKIGLLRQYLNERTSKELITNEELETFLLK